MIKNAVIIHGPGRSGTTLLSNILSLHRDFYWISGYNNRFPKYPILSMFNEVQRNSWIESYSRGKKNFPRPSEAYGFWRNFFSDFEKENGTPTEEEAEKAIKAIEGMRNYAVGNRFITKLTGLSRYNFIQAVFESPTIIWIDRDPTAVVMSYYKQRWKYKNRPEEFSRKSEIVLIDEYMELYQRIRADKSKLQQFHFVQVFYEDLVENPGDFFETLCNKLNLKFTNNFKKLITSWDIRRGTNTSYLNLIKEDSQIYLRESLQKQRELLGYPR